MNVTVNNSDIEVFEIADKKITYDRYFISSNFFNIINTIKPSDNATQKEKNKYDKKIIKNEKLMVVFKNVKIDGVPVFGHDLIDVFEEIQNNQQTKKYIQTKNQHYLKQSIQKKWDDRYIYAFNAHAKKKVRSNNIPIEPPVYKHISYKHTMMVNVKDWLDSSDFDVKDIGADNNTYTLFMEDTVIFIEGLLVNKVEEFLEGLVKKTEFNNIDKNMVLFLTKTNYIERIFSIQRLAFTIYEGKIDEFYLAFQNESDIKITRLILEKETFNLHIGWVLPFYPAFLFGLDCSLMPLTPYEAIIITVNSDELNEKLISILKKMEQFYFDINSYAFEIYNLLTQTQDNYYENINIAETTEVSSSSLILHRKNNIIKTNHNEFLEKIVQEDKNYMLPYIKGNTIRFLLDNGDLSPAFKRSIQLIKQKIINDFKPDALFIFMMDIHFEQLFLFYDKFYNVSYKK